MYHVSKQDLGSQSVLTPQIPKNMFGDECGTTERVCFSPTIRQCFIGIIGHEISEEATLLEAWLKSDNFTYTVYHTDQTLIKPPSVEISDYRLTDEHWSLIPIEVNRLGYTNNIDFETFKKFDLINQPFTRDDSQRSEGYEKLTPYQKDLIEKWYSHTFMRSDDYITANPDPSENEEELFFRALNKILNDRQE